MHILKGPFDRQTTKTGSTPFETFSLMNSDILLRIQDSLSNAESAIMNIISIFILNEARWLLS
jgi:hypothetical protein